MLVTQPSTEDSTRCRTGQVCKSSSRTRKATQGGCEGTKGGHLGCTPGPPQTASCKPPCCPPDPHPKPAQTLKCEQVHRSQHRTMQVPTSSSLRHADHLVVFLILGTLRGTSTQLAIHCLDFWQGNSAKPKECPETKPHCSVKQVGVAGVAVDELLTVTLRRKQDCEAHKKLCTRSSDTSSDEWQ